MAIDAPPHHRRTIRLKGYDYAQAGAYFITLCTHRRVCYFGDIADGARLVSSEPGLMALQAWTEVPHRYPGVELDAFVLMPNHLHAVFLLTAPLGMDVSTIVGRYKSWTEHLYGQQVRAGHWPAYEQRFWHRNYWEHVVRDQHQLDAIRLYIENNPAKWLEDKLNPANPLVKRTR